MWPKIVFKGVSRKEYNTESVGQLLLVAKKKNIGNKSELILQNLSNKIIIFITRTPLWKLLFVINR